MKKSKIIPIKETSEVVLENIEVVIDNLMCEDIIKDIPFIGNIFKLSKIGLTISDKILLKKIHTFIEGSRIISQEKKQEFVDKILKSEETRIEFGEKILNSITKVDTNKKAKLISHIYVELIQDNIQLNVFYDLLDLLEQLKIHYLNDLIIFALNFESHPLNTQLNKHFEDIGFKSLSSNEAFYSYSEKTIKINDQNLTRIGLVLIKLLIKKEIQLVKNAFIQNCLSIHRFEKVDTPIILGKFNPENKMLTSRKSELLDIISIEKLSELLKELNLKYFDEVSFKSSESYGIYHGSFFSVKYNAKIAYRINTEKKVHIYENGY